MRVARAGTKRNDTRQPSDETILIMVARALDGNRYDNVTCLYDSYRYDNVSFVYDSYARKHALLYELSTIVLFKIIQTQIKENAALLFV